jgi:sulfofructose kinase
MTGGSPSGDLMAECSAGRTPLVFVGAATLDAIALVRGLPQPDERVVAEAITHAGGGPAATAAVAAARLGMPAAFIGAVGDDETGGRIVAGLQAENVDVSGVQMVPGTHSAASVVVVDSNRHTRAICARPGAAPLIEGSGAELLRSADWVHVDHLGWGPVSRAVQELPRRQRPRISVDGGNDIDGLMLGGVELFVPTVAALARRYGERDIGSLLNAALAEGAAQVIATRGGAGCAAAAADGTRADVPGCRTPVVSTLGAGDVFHGAVLAAAARGMPLPGAIAYANVAAAMSCAALDGRSAIPSHTDVLSALAALPVSP